MVKQLIQLLATWRFTIGIGRFHELRIGEQVDLADKVVLRISAAWRHDGQISQAIGIQIVDASAVEPKVVFDFVTRDTNQPRFTGGCLEWVGIVDVQDPVVVNIRIRVIANAIAISVGPLEGIIWKCVAVVAIHVAISVGPFARIDGKNIVDCANAVPIYIQGVAR